MEGWPASAGHSSVIPSLSDAGPIPLLFTCYADGHKAMSPQLRWANVPEAARSFLIMATGPADHGRRSHTVALYALDQLLPRPSNATRDAVLPAMDGRIVGASVYYGVLERVP